MADAVVPWEDGFVIGQGFNCPGNFPVSKYGMAFEAAGSTWDLQQLNTGGKKSDGKGAVNRGTVRSNQNETLEERKEEWEEEKQEQQDEEDNTKLDTMEFEWRVVSSYSEMAKAISASLSFGVKGYGSSTSASASALSNTSVTNKSIIGLMTAKFETDAFIVKEDPPLSRAAKNLLSQKSGGGVLAFYEQFGTHFIAGQKVGGAFHGLVEVRFKSESDQKEFSAEVQSRGRAFGVRYKAAASFGMAISNSKGEKEVRVKVSATGWKKGADANGKIKTEKDGQVVIEDGEMSAEDMVMLAQNFAKNNQGVAVAAVLRPFNTLPEFVAMAAASTIPLTDQFLSRSSEAILAQKLTLESIRLNILDATLTDVIGALPYEAPDADADGKDESSAVKARRLKEEVEAAKLLLAGTESKAVLKQLERHMKSLRRNKRKVDPAPISAPVAPPAAPPPPPKKHECRIFSRDMPAAELAGNGAPLENPSKGAGEITANGGPTTAEEVKIVKTEEEETDQAMYESIFVSDALGPEVMQLTSVLTSSGPGVTLAELRDPVLSRLYRRSGPIKVYLKNSSGNFVSVRYQRNQIFQSEELKEQYEDLFLIPTAERGVVLIASGKKLQDTGLWCFLEAKWVAEEQGGAVTRNVTLSEALNIGGITESMMFFVERVSAAVKKPDGTIETPAQYAFKMYRGGNYLFQLGGGIDTGELSWGTPPTFEKPADDADDKTKADADKKARQWASSTQFEVVFDPNEEANNVSRAAEKNQVTLTLDDYEAALNKAVADYKVQIAKEAADKAAADKAAADKAAADKAAKDKAAAEAAAGKPAANEAAADKPAVPAKTPNTPASATGLADVNPGRDQNGSS